MADLVPAEVEAPETKKVVGGRFSLYFAPGERVVLAMRIDGTEDDHHWVIPKALLKLIGRSAGVDAFDALRSLAGEEKSVG